MTRILFLVMWKDQLQTLSSLPLSDKYQAVGFVRQAPIFCPVCLLYIACFGQSLSSFSGTKYTHTPFQNERPGDTKRALGSLSPTIQWGALHCSAHPTPRAPVGPGFDLWRPYRSSPSSPRGRRHSPAGRPPSPALPSSFAGEPENPERTGPARRRMLSSEQVQFASRKLERYTSVGGGRGGTSGQPDSPTTTSGLSPPLLDLAPSSAPPRVARVLGVPAAWSGRRSRSVPPPALPQPPAPPRGQAGPGSAASAGGRRRRQRQRPAPGGAGRPGRGRGPGPGAVGRNAAAAASGLRSLSAAGARIGWVAGRGPRPPGPSPRLARPRGSPRGPGRPVGLRPCSAGRARPLAAPRPDHRHPSPRPEAPRGHHAGAAAAVRVFQRGERAQVAGAAGSCAEKGEERGGPRFPAAAPARALGLEKGWGGGARAGPSFFPVSPPRRKDGARREVPPLSLALGVDIHPLCGKAAGSQGEFIRRIQPLRG